MSLAAPLDEAGVASAIAEAAAANEPLLVCGNGTKTKMLRPVQAARSLSVRNLTGITLRAPKEMVNFRPCRHLAGPRSRQRSPRITSI